MKAHEILMFLLIFNLTLWLLGGYGLNIYNLGTSGNYTSGDFESGTEALENQDIGDQDDLGQAFLFEIASISFTVIIGTIAGLAIIGYILRSQPSPQSIIYGLFAGLFLTSYTKTVQVFYNISRGIPDIFLIIFLVFTAITAFTFFFGFAQIVTQSWRYMK